MPIVTTISIDIKEEASNTKLILKHNENANFITCETITDLQGNKSSIDLNKEDIYNLIGALNKLKFRLNEK